MRGRLAALLGSALEIRPGEGGRTALLFLHLLCASSVFILGRTVRDTLFLSRYPLSALPWMFVLYGGVSALVVVGYARVADKLPRHVTIIASLVVGIATYVGTWMLVRTGQSWVYPTFYVWSEVAANLFLVQFWTFANDLHDPRSARRLFPTIGAARILGVVLIGFSSSVVVKLVGTPQLLFVLVGLMVLMVLIAFTLRRYVKPGATSSRSSGLKRRPPRIAGDPYVQALAACTLVTFAALTLGDYQFKAIARATYQEDELARFFSLFYGVTGITSFIFQLGATPRILRRFGVGLAFAVMPAVFGLASATLIFLPLLAVATVMKFSDNGFQYTIYETTLQALYAPFAPEIKARTRALLDAVIKPLSYGVGGVLLVGLATRMSVSALSYVTVPLVGVWLLMVPVVRRRHQAALEATLSARGALELEGEKLAGLASRDALLATLERGEPRTARLVLEHLEEDGAAEVTRALERLVANEAVDDLLRAEALVALTRRPDASAAVALFALEAPNPVLRAAAVRSVAALLGDDAVDPLAPLVFDAEREVRAAALAGLLRHGGVEGAMIASTHLAELLSQTEPTARAEAAVAMGEVGPAAFKALARLFDDEDRDVRRTALKAARRVRDPRLLPMLLTALEQPHKRPLAADAIAAIGELAVPALLSLLADASTPRDLRMALARLLRRIPCQAAYDGLRAQVEVEDSHLRLRIFGALSNIRDRLELPPEPVESLLDWIAREIEHADQQLRVWHDVRPHFGTALLDEALALRRGWSSRRVFRILQLRYESPRLRLVRRALSQPARRGNALETLDALLDAKLRARVLPYLDELAGQTASAGDGKDKTTEAGKRAAEAFLLEHTRRANPYMAAVALDALDAHDSEQTLAAALALTGHANAFVRETVLEVLARRADHAEALAALERLSDDPDAVVARRARALADPETREKELAMAATLEKVLLLKKSEIFAEVPGEALTSLVHLAEEQTFRRDEQLCREGDEGNVLYVIVEGRVSVSSDGHELAQLGPGEAVGEMAVLDTQPRSATVTAIEQTRVLAMGREEFLEVLQEQWELAEGVILMLTRRLRGADHPQANGAKG